MCQASSHQIHHCCHLHPCYQHAEEQDDCHCHSSAARARCIVTALWQANSVSQHGNGQPALGRARLAVHICHPLISPCHTAKQTTLHPDYQVLHAA